MILLPPGLSGARILCKWRNLYRHGSYNNVSHFFPLIFTVHWFILLKVFVLSKSSGRFAGLLHACLLAWYNSTSVVLQTAYPFLCFICAHELSITQKHILSTPHVKTSESALLAYRDQRIMHVADVKLYFIFLYSHLHSLHSRKQRKGGSGDSPSAKWS